MKTQTFMGQKILFATELFGKPYFWMQDGDGTIYLAKAKKAEAKDFTVDFTQAQTGWVPDFL